MSTELEQLRKRVKAQRRELRFLSKAYSGFLRGFESGVRSASVDCLREKMIRAFGHEAVWRAERGITASVVSTHAPPPEGAAPATPPFPSSSPSTSPHPGSEPGTSRGLLT